MCFGLHLRWGLTTPTVNGDMMHLPGDYPSIRAGMDALHAFPEEIRTRGCGKPAFSR